MHFRPTHILVPVDLDFDADRALVDGLVEAATDIAREYGARITLVHAAPPLATYVPVSPDMPSAAYTAMAAALEARDAVAEGTLKVLVAGVKAKDIHVDSLMMTESRSVPELVCRAAEQVGADLIVLTTHARHGVRRMLMGSVAERVAHLAEVPVLLLKMRRP